MLALLIALWFAFAVGAGVLFAEGDILVGALCFVAACVLLTSAILMLAP